VSGSIGDLAKVALSGSEMSPARASLTASWNTSSSWESKSAVVTSTWFEKVLVFV
jgi:hypothetical protein